jgi:chemotaxis protein methyltransferase CheR
MPRLVVCSEFFLDLERWQALRDRVLPDLLARRSALRVWSAGCHVGKEPYSLAIMLDEESPGGDHMLLATDNDADHLGRARAGGPFSEQDVSQLTAAQRTRYLQPGGPPYVVVDRLVRRVRFEPHDLRTDPYESDFDLILYRDVEPFFCREQRDGIHARLAAALRPGGVLFVGSTESIPQATEIGLASAGRSLFRRS